MTGKEWSKMKILMICTEKLPVPPVLGGAIQTYISGTLPYLSKDHEITVLGISDPSLPDQETIDGIQYVRVPGKILEIYRIGVVEYVAANQFDLIHIFNRPKLILPIRKVAPHTKLTLSMHNDMFQPGKIEHEEAAAALKEISSIVTVSDYVGNVIRSFHPEAEPKLNTVYSGVDTTRFLPGSHPSMQKIRKELREAHNLDNRTVIMFAGRLSRNKGVDKLVRALPDLSKKHKDLALVIVGSKWFSQNDVTDYVAYVRALANRLSIPVVTTGFVSPAEIQKWYSAADLFVCTSIWQEPLARVHYEAMAAGLPIITTARGGNPEVIDIGENGFIVENPNIPSEFAEKIDHVLANKTLMENMGKTGRKLAETLYEWDRVAAQILDVWNRSMQETPVENSENEQNLVSEEVMITPDKLSPLTVNEQQESPTIEHTETSMESNEFEQDLVDERNTITPDELSPLAVDEQQESPTVEHTETSMESNEFEQDLVVEINTITPDELSPLAVDEQQVDPTVEHVDLDQPVQVTSIESIEDEQDLVDEGITVNHEELSPLAVSNEHLNEDVVDEEEKDSKRSCNRKNQKDSKRSCKRKNRRASKRSCNRKNRRDSNKSCKRKNQRNSKNSCKRKNQRNSKNSCKRKNQRNSKNSCKRKNQRNSKRSCN